jgi:hypothetical protein
MQPLAKEHEWAVTISGAERAPRRELNEINPVSGISLGPRRRHGSSPDGYTADFCPAALPLELGKKSEGQGRNQ